MCMDDAQCSDLYQREYLWQHEGTYVRSHRHRERECHFTVANDGALGVVGAEIMIRHGTLVAT